MPGPDRAGVDASGLCAVPLAPGDTAELAGTLAEAGLPTSDLADEGRVFLRFVDDDETVGFGGLEGIGPDRLLRSLVALGGRGRGRGTAMLGLLEDYARQAGVERLHLLTTTAGPFFRARGYVEGRRSAAPASIAASREFRSLCPDSADYLTKALTG